MTVAIVVAGGTGSRMNLGYNKAFAKLAGKPIILHSLEVFQNCSQIDQIVIVAGNADAGTAKDDCVEVQKIIKEHQLSKVKTVVPGASTRMQSVANGLAAANPNQSETVLIHDAGRPFISESLIDQLIVAVAEHGAAVCGATPKDTIQVINQSGFSVDTLDRSTLLSVFTPMAARYELIQKGREKAAQQGYLDTPGFEDSALLQKADIPVKVVVSDYTNIKITTPEDLLIAERLVS